MGLAQMKQQVENLFALADVKINGDRAWDIQVKNDKFYARVLADGAMGVGESYMDGWWECEDMAEMSFRTQRADLERKLKPSAGFVWAWLQAKFFNMQNRSRAKRDMHHHYDIGNDLYKLMLDKRMVYTCAYWKDAKTLDEAQEAKLDLVCRKIGLKKGMRVLDIGCGWGSFAKFAAEKYGAEVVGITIAKEQLTLARELCKGLPIEIRFQDYRDVNEKFDRIVSIGMFEAVGPKNHREYFEMANRCLKDDGIFLLHTLGRNDSITVASPWVDKYIFPGAVVPSIQQMGKAIENLFVMEDWHNFGTYYALTTVAWWENFKKHYAQLKHKYGERFYRMWRFYLLMGSGIVKARQMQLWQIVLTKNGIVGGYETVR